MKNMGLIYALSAYLIWGVVPVFWKVIDHIPSTEIVAHRMLWSAILVTLLIFILGQRRQLFALLAQKQVLGRLFVASILISVNWGVYIWAVNSGHIVEGSMGYFINPLINVLLGVLFFKETLRLNQWLAIGLAAIGVAYLILVHGDVPYIALTLAFTFSAYGAVKKSINVPATHGMAIETGLLVIPALAFMAYLISENEFHFGQQRVDDLFLILGGALTLAPLILFAAAAQRISMTALGMTQYLGPTLQLLIGVWIYNEPFGSERQIAFGFIWLGLLFYSIDQVNNRRQRRNEDRRVTARRALEGAAGVVVKK